MALLIPFVLFDIGKGFGDQKKSKDARVRESCYNLAKFIDEDILSMEEELGNDGQWITDLYNYLAEVSNGSKKTDQAWIDKTTNDMHSKHDSMCRARAKRLEREDQRLKERLAVKARELRKKAKAEAEAKAEADAIFEREVRFSREEARAEAEAKARQAELDARRAEEDAIFFRNIPRFVPATSKIYIKSVAHGTYLYSRGDSRDGVGHRKTPSFWTQINNADGTVFLQADGCTLHMSGSSERGVSVRRNALDWEKWVVEGGHIKSRAHGTYLSAVAGENVVNLQPHTLGWEEFSVVPVTDAEAIHLEADHRVAEANAKHEREMAEMHARLARHAEAVPAFLSCPSRPVTSTNLGPREAWDYSTACYQVRRAIEDAVGTPSGVKHRIKNLGASKEDTAWGIDLHDYLCSVIHTGWDKKGSAEWFEQMMLRLKHVFNLEPVITRPS
jgi:hypothetical protein